MKTIAKIALSIPDHTKPDRHFSFRVRQNIINEQCEFKMPPKIFAISDIEGNFIALLELLRSNSVIDKYLSWTFGEGHLVIVGDCFDRGEQVVECLWLIYCLEERARKKGGYVHFILGNHEIMNMNGDWRYIHPKYAQASKIPFTALYHGNNELWYWLCTKNIMEKVGDILFVHGGVSEEVLSLKLSISEINNRVRPYYSMANKSFDDPLLNLVFQHDHSPFWYRGYYTNDVSEVLIDNTLQHFSVNTIITGHTVMSHVNSFFNGKVINVNTNHSLDMSEGLVIKNKKFYRANRNGKKEKIT